MSNSSIYPQQLVIEKLNSLKVGYEDLNPGQKRGLASDGPLLGLVQFLTESLEPTDAVHRDTLKRLSDSIGDENIARTNVGFKGANAYYVLFGNQGHADFVNSIIEAYENV